MADDDAHGQVVMFGGRNGGFGVQDDTWTWDGTDWSIPFEASIALTPPSGPAGTIVEVTGSAFAANEKVTLSFVDSTSGTMVLAIQKTDEVGGFTTQVTIPVTATTGDQKVRAQGGRSGGRAHADRDIVGKAEPAAAVVRVDGSNRMTTFSSTTQLMATIPASAQTPNHAATSAKASTATRSAPARTPDGHPDLQGEWTYDTLTPLERPENFANKPFFNATEEAVFEAAVRASRLSLLGDENVKTSGDIGFAGRGKLLPDRRTALIIDPPNGTLPPLLPTAQHRLNNYLERQRQHVADGPEDFGLSERCIWWRSPPIFAR
jgi:hypothetical protein